MLCAGAACENASTKKSVCRQFISNVKKRFSTAFLQKDTKISQNLYMYKGKTRQAPGKAAGEQQSISWLCTPLSLASFWPPPSSAAVYVAQSQVCTTQRSGLPTYCITHRDRCAHCPRSWIAMLGLDRQCTSTHVWEFRLERIYFQLILSIFFVVPAYVCIRKSPKISRFHKILSL